MGKISDLIATIDAITVDLEALVGVPPHNTERYAQRPVVTSEDTPLLAVYSKRMPWQLIATPATYFMRPEVFVGWYVSAAEEVEQADGYGELMQSAAAAGDLIADRLATYAGGIPGMAGVWARVIETTIDREEALMFSIVHRLEVER